MKTAMPTGILLFLLAACGDLFAGSRAEQLNSNNDHGLWLDQSFSGDVTQKWAVTLFTQQRWGADYRLFWYQEYSLISQYDCTKKVKELFCIGDIFTSFSMGPAFSQISRILNNTRGISKWVWISRPMIDVNAALSWHEWLLTQRLRASYIDYNSSHYEKHFTLRYRLQLFAPWKFTCLNINPYLFNEFFFRPTTYSASKDKGLVGGLHENRFRIGLVGDIVADISSFSLYWQWRALKKKPTQHPRWWNNYDWGLSLSLTF